MCAVLLKRTNAAAAVRLPVLHRPDTTQFGGLSREMTKSEIVWFRLDQDEDGYPPVQTESVWAIPFGEGTYILDNVPFFAEGVSWETSWPRQRAQRDTSGSKPFGPFDTAHYSVLSPQHKPPVGGKGRRIQASFLRSWMPKRVEPPPRTLLR